MVGPKNRCGVPVTIPGVGGGSGVLTLDTPERREKEEIREEEILQRDEVVGDFLQRTVPKQVSSLGGKEWGFTR